MTRRLLGLDIGAEHETMAIRPKRPPAAEAALQATGYLDAVSEDGWVRGWAWYPDAPSRIVQLDILADGVPAGRVRADTPRDDLRQNGIGEGAHAFAFPLPDALVLRGTKTTISARDSATGAPVGTPVVFERRVATDAQARIEELESKARLLDSALAALAERQAQDAQAASRLFATVGNFFMHLADAAASGQPEEAAGTLRTAIEDVQSRFEPIELEFACIPSVTVSVGTGASLAAIYDTIRAIQQTSRGVRMEVLVMDDGSNPQTCLLPLVVTNLRYVRATGASGSVALLNQAARTARGKVFVHFAAGLAPAGAWLQGVLTRFSTDPKLAAIAAKISGLDGVLRSAGTSQAGFAVSNLTGAGLNAASDRFSSPMHVPALSADAFAVRLETWTKHTDPNYGVSSLDAALQDTCDRLRIAGLQIIYDPRFSAVWQAVS